MSTAIAARTVSSIATIARDRSVGMRSRRIARNAITGILPTRIDDAIQPMDARLAVNEMTEVVFDARPNSEWRTHFEGNISVLGLD